MKIKRIRAKNFREALSLVKKELGSDAVILSSEDRKGMKPFVEVTAAIDYDPQGDYSDQTVSQKGTNSPPPDRTPEAHLLPEMFRSDFAELKKEIMGLRNHIEDMKNGGYELTIPEERKHLYSFLKSRSIKEEYALELVRRADAREDIEEVMSDDLNVSGPVKNALLRCGDSAKKEDRRISMLIGPTGVGKTTTIAKLASMAIREGRKVGMISIDTYKIGAAEQIRIYSRMIGIPLDIVAGRESFRKSVEKFNDRDVILVDTTGQNPRDIDYINGLKDICQTGMPIETQLLLSASSDCDFLIETCKYYSSLPVDYMAFTKTDEAVRLGSIYNLSCLYQKPVAYITTGQRVPGNIEFMDSRKLTDIILRGSA